MGRRSFFTLITRPNQQQLSGEAPRTPQGSGASPPPPCSSDLQGYLSLYAMDLTPGPDLSPDPLRVCCVPPPMWGEWTNAYLVHSSFHQSGGGTHISTCSTCSHRCPRSGTRSHRRSSSEKHSLQGRGRNRALTERPQAALLKDLHRPQH